MIFDADYLRELSTRHDIMYVNDGMYRCATCGYGMTLDRVGGPCDGPGKTAKDKRYVGIGLVTSKWMPFDADYIYTHRETIATEICGLIKLGRRDRWQIAVQRWANAVGRAENAAEAKWALAQYSIYAGHNA